MGVLGYILLWLISGFLAGVIFFRKDIKKGWLYVSDFITLCAISFFGVFALMLAVAYISILSILKFFRYLVRNHTIENKIYFRRIKGK